MLKKVVKSHYNFNMKCEDWLKEAVKPITYNDREEWLQALNNKLKDQSINTVLACSALKEKYRKKLIRGLDINIFWFCLKGEFDLINQRLKKRNNHFFSSSLLQSQYDIIEYPDYCNFIDISESKNKIVELIKLKLLK